MGPMTIALLAAALAFTAIVNDGAPRAYGRVVDAREETPTRGRPLDL